MPDRFAHLFAPREGTASYVFDESCSSGSLSEQVARRIMVLIKAGAIRAGDRLPTESQMTRALGISRAPLREALKALTLMGVLESRQGGRYTVTDLSPLRLVEPFNVMLSANRYDHGEHYAVRSVIDLECVRLCIERAHDDRRADISRIAGEGRDTIGDLESFRVHDGLFHGAIYAACGNPLLETLAHGLFRIALNHRCEYHSRPGHLALSCDDHERIAEAIAARDGDRAIAAYRGHLQRVPGAAADAAASGRQTAPA